MVVVYHLGNTFCAVMLATACMVVHAQTIYRNDTNADVMLGGMFPVHKSNSNGSCGKIQDYGYQRAEAMVLAVNIINNNSRLLPGLRMGFDIRDTCSSPFNALNESVRFVMQGKLDGTIIHSKIGISGAVGPASSTESARTAGFLQAFQIPQISYASTAVTLSDKTRYPYFLRTLPSDVFQAQAMADVVVHFNWTSVIAMHSDDDYGLSGIKAFVQHLNQHLVDTSKSFSIVDKPIPIPRNAEDSLFDTIVETINSPRFRNSSVVVIYGQPDTIEGLLRAINRTIDHRPLTFVVSDGAGDNLPMEYYPLAKGMISIVPEYNTSTAFNSYFTSLKPLNNAKNPWFREYWESLFKCSFTGPQPTCNETAQAITRENYNQNSKVPFVMDAVFAFAHAMHNLLFAECDDFTICDKVVHMTRCCDKRILTGDALLKHLKSVSFNGVSGKIDFDENGDQTRGYVINHLQKVSADAYEFVRVAKWNQNTKIEKITDFFGNFRFSNSSSLTPLPFCTKPCSAGHYPVLVETSTVSCLDCERCPGNREVSDGKQCVKCEDGYSPSKNMSRCQVDSLRFLDWDNPLSVLLLLASFIGQFLTIATSLLFSIYRNDEIVKATSKDLNALKLVGLFLCFSVPLFALGEPAPVTCGIRRFLIGFSFLLCFAALLVKTYETHRIYNLGVNITDYHAFSRPVQLLIVGIFMFLHVVFSLSWLAANKPGITYKYNNQTTEVACSDMPYVGPFYSMCLNIVLLACSTYYSYRTRKVSNEARYINITLNTVMIIWVTFISVYIAISYSDLDRAVYLVGLELSAITLSGFAILCGFFFPKLYVIVGKNENELDTDNTNISNGFQDNTNQSTSQPENSNADNYMRYGPCSSDEYDGDSAATTSSSSSLASPALPHRALYEPSEVEEVSSYESMGHTSETEEGVAGIRENRFKTQRGWGNRQTGHGLWNEGTQIGGRPGIRSDGEGVEADSGADGEQAEYSYGIDSDSEIEGEWAPMWNLLWYDKESEYWDLSQDENLMNINEDNGKMDANRYQGLEDNEGPDRFWNLNEIGGQDRFWNQNELGGIWNRWGQDRFSDLSSDYDDDDDDDAHIDNNNYEEGQADQEEENKKMSFKDYI